MPPRRRRQPARVVDALRWTCHVCGRERPDDKISVLTTDLSDRFGGDGLVVTQNVRFCNDTPDCATGAPYVELRPSDRVLNYSYPIIDPEKFGVTPGEEYGTSVVKVHVPMTAERMPTHWHPKLTTSEIVLVLCVLGVVIILLIARTNGALP